MKRPVLPAVLLLSGCIHLDELGSRLGDGGFADDLSSSPDQGPRLDLGGAPCSKGSPVAVFTVHAPLNGQGVEVAPLRDGNFWLAMATPNDTSGQRIVVGTYARAPMGARTFYEAAMSPSDVTNGANDLRVRVSTTTLSNLYLAEWRPGSTVADVVAAPAPATYDGSGVPLPTPAFLDVSSSSFNCGSPTEGTADVSSFAGTRLAVNACGSTAVFEAGGAIITKVANVTDARVGATATGLGVGVYSSVVVDSTGGTKHTDGFVTITSPSSGTYAASMPIALNTALEPDFVVAISGDSQLLVAGREGAELRVVGGPLTGKPPITPLLTRAGVSGTVGIATALGHHLVVYQQGNAIMGSYAADSTSGWTDFLLVDHAGNPRVAADPLTGAFVVTYIDLSLPSKTAALVDVTCP